MRSAAAFWAMLSDTSASLAEKELREGQMKLLPVDEWLIEFMPDCIGIAAHEHLGSLHWTKYTLSDFPNRTSHSSSNFTKHLVSPEDLKTVIVTLVNRRSV